jgi:hypothetical protein
MAAGADLNRVYAVTEAWSIGGEKSPIVIPRDLDHLERRIRSTGAVLTIIDVLSEYLDAKVDNYRDSDVRKTLHQLKEVANRTHSCIVMLRHLRKQQGKAIYRGGGSIGIVGAARAGWAVAQHPEDESMRVLAAVKMNLALSPKPLGFKLIPVEGLGVARVDWRGEVDLGAEELLGESRSTPEASEEREERRGQLGLGIEAIREVLKDGPVWSSELLDAVVNKGKIVSGRTFDRARAKLDLVTKRERMPDGAMGWRVRLRREDEG